MQNLTVVGVFKADVILLDSVCDSGALKAIIANCVVSKMSLGFVSLTFVFLRETD